MAFLAAFAFFALGYLAQDVVMSSLDCTTQDSWSQETTDLEPWCIFQVIYSDSRAPIFLVRYPYHYLCFLSIGQFHVKKQLFETLNLGINLKFSSLRRGEFDWDRHHWERQLCLWRLLWKQDAWLGWESGMVSGSLPGDIGDTQSVGMIMRLSW